MKKREINHRYLNTQYTVDLIKQEVNEGLTLLNDIENPIVSVFGSHKPDVGDKYFEMAKELGFKLGKKGYAVVTGGGPGIMRAANEGAMESGSPSIGIKASLIKGEEMKEHIFTNELSYHFLFVRRFILSIKSDALVFFPGGFGTLNELFEYIVLIQLGFIDKVPMVCVDRAYWKGMFDWLKAEPRQMRYYINEQEDLGLIQFADSADEIIEKIV
jgi:uncharacterized protein (TIGR00730 family)